MFFLVAGISPKVKRLEAAPRICPNCGLAQAHLSRVDHYLNLFFIPVIPVKRGRPVLMCDRCRYMGGADTPAGAKAPPRKDALICRQCGRSLESGFVYCPYCGAKNK